MKRRLDSAKRVALDSIAAYNAHQLEIEKAAHERAIGESSQSQSAVVFQHGSNPRISKFQSRIKGNKIVRVKVKPYQGEESDEE